MKKAYKSKFIKKNTISETYNIRISHDIEIFNHMKHTAFTWNNQNKHFDDGRSIHLHLKEEYNCNDYFANSANRTALSMISSQKELRDMYISDMKEDITAIKKKIAKKQKRLKVLEDTKQSIIQYTNSDYHNPKKIKSCQNVHFEDDGRVRVQIFKKKTYFDNIYLFEHQWLDFQINRLRNNIKQLQHKADRLAQKIVSLQNDSHVHVCFGTRKLFYDTRLYGEERIYAIRKRRYSSMMISGRADSKDGNWVFSYDTVTGNLTYKSMTDWKGSLIIFPKVNFPYGQDKICDYIRNHKGAVAWEIRDCGNAWQITCIISQEENSHKNNYFDEGCIAFDMNYDNIAMAELDKCGNLLHHKTFHFQPELVSSGQLEQQLSHILEEVFQYADNLHKPIVCEQIKSIQKKKFYDKNTKRTRHISMFASNKIAMLTASKSEKYGIVVTYINPAYTSKTGLLKYKKRYGLSTHEAAAFVIGRRGMGFKDKVPEYWKQKLSEVKQVLPRLRQWKELYTILKKIPYRELNDILYPKQIPDDILYAMNF